MKCYHKNCDEFDEMDNNNNCWNGYESPSEEYWQNKIINKTRRTMYSQYNKDIIIAY